MRIYLQGEENEKDRVYSWLERNIRLNRKGYRLFCLQEIPRNEAGKIQYGQLG